MVGYKMVVKSGLMVDPMSSDLVKVIDLASTKLRAVHPYKGRYTVRLTAEEIRKTVGGADRARAVIVEAIEKANYITLRARGHWGGWSMFAKILFDGSELTVEYMQGAASVLKAMMMEG